MSLVGQAPPCRKPDRREQARFEALNRAGGAWEIVRETLKRPWLIRLIEPISADFAVLVGDAMRNLRSSLNQIAYQLAVQHSGPLTEDAERMRELLIRISGAQFDDWATSKNRQTKLRRSEIFGRRGSGRFARDSRSRSLSG
jgi:hypothetical protein